MLDPRNQGSGSMEDEEAPVLSAHALAALQEFMQEQEQREQNGNADNVSENWNMSQFWYDDATAQIMAAEVTRLSSGIPESAAVACIACPSLYTQLKVQCFVIIVSLWISSLSTMQKSSPHVNAQLFEYDGRFSRHGSDFTYYDYNHAEDLPDKFKHYFGVVVADPPYLSAECLEKINQAVQFLSKDPQKCPVLLLTGSVQQERALSIMGLRPCQFRPSHKQKLGNEFKVYTNYDPLDQLGGWETSK